MHILPGYPLGPKLTTSHKKVFKSWCQLCKHHQKLDVVLENKMVQKLKLETNFFYKNWSPKLIFLNEIFFEKIQLIFYIENWLWKYDFSLKNPLSMLILGQKSLKFHNRLISKFYKCCSAKYLSAYWDFTAACVCLCLSVINKCCTKNIIIARHIDTPHETTGSFVYSVITY